MQFILGNLDWLCAISCFDSTCDSVTHSSTNLVGHGIDSSSFAQSQCLNDWLDTSPTITLTSGAVTAVSVFSLYGLKILF